MTTKKEKLFINIVLALFVAGIICCFTLYPILCDTVSAEELTSNSVLNFNQLYGADIRSGTIGQSLTFTGQPITKVSGVYQNYNNNHVPYLSSSINMISGHSYYIYLNNSDSSVRNTIRNDTSNIFILTATQNYQNIYKANSNFNLSFGFFAYANVTYNYEVTIQLIDLTQCFGSGNEPSTVEEFRSYFANDSYAYTISTLVPLNATTSYSQGYTDGIKSFSVITAADDLYNNSYYIKDSITNVIAKNDFAPYFQKLVPTSDQNDYLIFPMNTTIPANSNFTISGYINSYVYDTSGTLNIYAYINNKDYISLGTILFSGSAPKVFNLNINVPFSVSNIAFNSSNSSCVLGDVTVSYKINNLQKLAQDNYDAGRASRDSDVTIAFENGKKVGMSQANPYTFNALFGAVFDAPIQALTGLLDFDILGVNMKGLYLSLFTLALIIFVVKLCLGKV